MLTPDIQARAREARRTRGRRPRMRVARGDFHDLEASFERISAVYFSSSIERIPLSWSRQRSRYTLGRYDASHHVVYISRILDQAGVPDYVLDYVMYHELLHARHHTQVKKNRLITHTREFRQEESRFRDYTRAREWLRRHI
jgi:hypothetical protein